MNRPQQPIEALIALPPLTKETCRFNPYPPRAYDKHALTETEVAELEQRLAVKL